MKCFRGLFQRNKLSGNIEKNSQVFQIKPSTPASADEAEKAAVGVLVLHKRTNPRLAINVAVCVSYAIVQISSARTLHVLYISEAYIFRASL